MISLEGKTALVTGGARGQGEAEVRLFAELGARVVIGDVLVDQAQALAEAIGGETQAVRLDVTDEASWQEACTRAAQPSGRIDILVNNAAILKETSIEAMTRADFEQVVAVNQVGPFLGMKAILRFMKGSGGSIVNISSIGGMRPAQGYAAYGATKFAIRGLTKVAALEFAPFNVRVNTVLPGFVQTAMTEHLLAKEAVRQRIAQLPLRRAASPIEIARTVAFLASDAASYITGSEIIVDGGQLTGVQR